MCHCNDDCKSNCKDSLAGELPKTLSDEELAKVNEFFATRKNKDFGNVLDACMLFGQSIMYAYWEDNRAEWTW